MRIRWDLLLKLLIILVFLSPFVYGPFERLRNLFLAQLQAQALARYQPIPESEIPNRNRFHFVDLGPCANADYHHNPFVPDPTSGGDHFPALEAGFYQSRKVPFQITGPYSKTGKPSVVTTGENPYFSCSLALEPKPSQALHLAFDGAWIEDQASRMARLEVRYQDGAATARILLSNRDIWSYQFDPKEVRLPSRAVLWKSLAGQKIVTVSIPLEKGKIPASFEIHTMPAVGKAGKQPAIALFAATQELAKGA